MSRRPHRTAERVTLGLGVLLVVAGVLVATGPGASAASNPNGPSGYFVTFAKRECAAYTDISANRARNNIQESLQDLGPDTSYVAGEAISVAKENAAQPACTPVTGWKFTLGQGIAGSKVNNLSVVSSPYATSITTRASTPELDTQARTTGRTVPGAVTIELTNAQAERAQRGSSLWAQEGTPTDPLLTGIFGAQYSFGSLRCAVDNLNGDNVEFVSFTQNSRHVFCYAYNVTAPPAPGTIIIRKSAPGGNLDTEPFEFDGNVSYNPGGLFTLNVVNGAPASQTFVRAAGTPWHVRELVPPNWTLTSIVCTQNLASAVSTDAVATTTDITLVANDVVTCTYLDTPIAPPVSTLVIRKITRGGTGTFPFTVTGPSYSQSTAATTAAADTAVDVSPALPTLTTAGDYTITETLPASSAVVWAATLVECDGTDIVPAVVGNQVSITAPLTLGTDPVCTFTNTATPLGSLTIRKTTVNSVGTAGFEIFSKVVPADFTQTATTLTPGVPVTATGDPLAGLPLGQYLIDELAPESDPATGAWAVGAITCTGTFVDQGNGVALVTLTTGSPDVTCDFTNTFTATTTTTAPTASVATTTTTAGGGVGSGNLTPTTTVPSVSNRLAVTGESRRLWFVALMLIGAGLVLIGEQRRRSVR